MKLLVTGGAGFIGSCFIKHILKKYPNYQVTNLDALTYCGNLNNLKDIEINPNYKFIHGNICDSNLVNKLVKDVDYIVNFAAESHVDNSIKNPDIFYETNIKGTLTLLNAAKSSNIERYIQISTDEVYGSLDDKTSYFTEDSPLRPNSPYSASKAGADLSVRAFYKTYELPVIITRCSNNFGPYQYPEKLIPFFISKLKNDEKIPIYGNGSNIRDWLYVYDHCSAVDLVLHKGNVGEIYNIGGHNEKTNLEIAKIILNQMGKNDSYIEFVHDRPGHDKRYAISNIKISAELGWKPLYKFEESMQQTIDWYLKNNYKTVKL